MSETKVQFRYAWIDPSIENKQNQMLLKHFEVFGLQNIKGASTIAQLFGIIEDLKQNHTLIIISSNSMVEEIKKQKILQNKRVYRKIIVFCHSQETAKSAMQKYKSDQCLKEVHYSDMSLAHCVKNIQVQLTEGQEIIPKHLSSEQYYSRIKLKQQKKRQFYFEEEGKIEKGSSKSRFNKVQEDNQSIEQSQSEESREEEEEAKKEVGNREQKLNGIWVDQNISHNNIIMSRLQEYIRFKSFDEFEKAYNFIESQIEKNRQKQYILVFANNIASKVLGISNSKQNNPNSLFPYQNVTDYYIYCGNQQIGFKIVSKVGLEDTVQITSEESKLTKWIKLKYQEVFH